jgi:hypothetical protein
VVYLTGKLNDMINNFSIRHSNVFLFQSKLHMVTVLGSGLLVGTALAVIIPEGVNALYEESVHRMYPLIVMLNIPKISFKATVTVIHS